MWNMRADVGVTKKWRVAVLKEIITIFPANGMSTVAVMDCPSPAARNSQGLNREPVTSVSLGNQTEIQVPGHY